MGHCSSFLLWATVPYSCYRPLFLLPAVGHCSSFLLWATVPPSCYGLLFLLPAMGYILLLLPAMGYCSSFLLWATVPPSCYEPLFLLPAMGYTAPPSYYRLLILLPAMGYCFSCLPWVTVPPSCYGPLFLLSSMEYCSSFLLWSGWVGRRPPRLWPPASRPPAPGPRCRWQSCPGPTVGAVTSAAPSSSSPARQHCKQNFVWEVGTIRKSSGVKGGQHKQSGGFAFLSLHHVANFCLKNNHACLPQDTILPFYWVKEGWWGFSEHIQNRSPLPRIVFKNRKHLQILLKWTLLYG